MALYLVAASPLLKPCAPQTQLQNLMVFPNLELATLARPGPNDWAGKGLCLAFLLRKLTLETATEGTCYLKVQAPFLDLKLPTIF